MAYDATRHHVGLGADVSTLTGLVLVGPRSKALAGPVFEKPSNIGTDDLIGQTTHSVWTQNDYSGGEFQEDWSDPAMFSECVSMLPDQLTRRLRTVRPFDAYLTDETDTLTPTSFEHMSGYLFIVFNAADVTSKIYRYHPSDPSATAQRETINTSHLPAGKSVTAAAWNTNSERLWIGTNEPKIQIIDWDSAAAAGSRIRYRTTLSVPSAATKVAGIHIFGQMKFIVTKNVDSNQRALDDDDSYVYLFVSGASPNTKWSGVGQLPGDYIKSITYNNAVYILSRLGDGRTYLSMTQGDQVFPVVEFPYYFRGQSICEYAGRLYIGGTGFDLEGDDRHGELFELTGTSLRLVRTFAGEFNGPTSGSGSAKMDTVNPGSANTKRRRYMPQMKSMCVAEGLLWMPDASYTGLEAYDATTDAFFGGPRYRHGDDSNLDITGMIPYGDSIYLWVIGDTTEKTGLYRTERRSDSGNAYNPYFITSDFHPEPARKKVWSKFVAITIGPVSPNLYYSDDLGDTWTAVTGGSTTTNGNRRTTEWDLVGGSVPATRSIRFKIEFPLTGASDESCCYLVAHSLSFLVKGDGKRRWQMTVNASLHPEGLDGAIVEQTPATVKTALWTLKDSDDPIAFRDTDGTDYSVVITDLVETQPAIDEENEAFIQLTLIEA